MDLIQPEFRLLRFETYDKLPYSIKIQAFFVIDMVN